MINLGKILKLAALYRFAAKIALGGFAPSNEARSAFSNLINYLSQDELIKIQEYYIQSGDPDNTPEVKAQGLSNLDALTDSILQEKADDEAYNAIYHSLDVINIEAEKASEGDSIQDTFEESVEDATSNVGYQEGEEIAQQGMGTVVDTDKKKNLIKERRNYLRHNPIEREKFLEKERGYESARQKAEHSSKKNYDRKKLIINKLMKNNMSAQQAESTFNSNLAYRIQKRVQSEGIDPQDLENELPRLKTEELLNYLKSLDVQSESSGSARVRKNRRRNKARKLYLEELIHENPSGNVKELMEKVQAMPIQEIDAIADRLMPETVQELELEPVLQPEQKELPSNIENVRPGVVRRKAV